MSSFCVIRVCSSDKMTQIHFLRLSKVWSMLRHGSLWLVYKKMLINSFMYFFGIFLLFLITKFVFLSFSFLSDKVSNFWNRILTNRKRELVVSNYQRNCMLIQEIFKTGQVISRKMLVLKRLSVSKQIMAYKLL